MENYLDNIKKKIVSKLDIQEIKVIDNSHKHKGHKFFKENMYHLQLDIKSNFLKKLPRIEAQRKIMKILEQDLKKKKIHAKKIKIK